MEKIMNNRNVSKMIKKYYKDMYDIDIYNVQVISKVLATSKKIIQVKGYKNINDKKILFMGSVTEDDLRNMCSYYFNNDNYELNNVKINTKESILSSISLNIDLKSKKLIK